MNTFTCRRVTACLVFVRLSGAFSAEVTAAEPFGWRVGPPAWSFKEFTFFEAIDKTASLGMTCIEALEGQPVMPGSDSKITPDRPDVVDVVER